MKPLIRSLILTLACGWLTAPSLPSLHAASEAGDENLREVLDMLHSESNPFKIRTLNQVMALTGDEAESFWPLYQQYEDELGKMSDQGLGLIEDFLRLQASGTRESKDWNGLAQRWLTIKDDRIELWEKYYKKLRKALSPYRAAQFLQVEHQIALFTDLSIAAEMPIIGMESLGSSAEPIPSIPTREEAVLVAVTAEVVGVDYANREVTLKGALGNVVTFAVDQRVERLNEIQTGDTVTAQYYLAIAAELRAPTAEEEMEPLVILEGAGKAPPGTSPAGGGLRRIRAVCTIEGLDRPTETVTLKGPRGQYATVRVADPANLPYLHINDTVVVTYTEALAVALNEL